MALTDFEKNVLGAREVGAPAPTFSPTPTATPAPEKKSFFSKAAGAVGNFGIGLVKGAADTVLSVPRNVEKVVSTATKLSIENQNNKIREQINAQNEELLKIYKSLPAGDPRKEKYKKLIQQNLDQFTALNDDERATIAQVDRDASWVPGDKEGKAEAFVDDLAATKNKAQQWGFKAEKIGELIVPSAKLAKADKAISGFNLIKNPGTAGKFVNAGTRILAKGGLEGATAAASTLGQGAYQGRLDTEAGREGLAKEMKTNALFAGGTKALFATGGEVLKATGVPKWFAQRTYKPDVKEVQREMAGKLDKDTLKLMSDKIAETKRTVTAYQQGIDEGLIPADKIFKTGKVLTDEAKKNVIDDIAGKMTKELGTRVGGAKADAFRAAMDGVDGSYDDIAKTAEKILRQTNTNTDLAEWAMANRLKGSTQNQYNQVTRLLDKAEDEVIKTAEAAKVKIPVEKGMKQFAKDLAEEYSGYGRGEVATKVDDFVASISDDGTVSVKEAIKFRRLIDSLRSKASFRNPKVGDNLQYWADDLRSTINGIDGIGDINKNYSLAMKAKELLGRKIVSESGKQPVGALEMYTAIPQNTGDGFSLAGLGAVAAKRSINSSRFQMGVNELAQTLGNSTPFGVATRRILPEVVREGMEPNVEY